MKLDIRIPVITLRVILIVLTVLLICFGLLLPFSFLSFNYFYNYLIPIPSIRLPLSNYILNYDFKNLPPFIIIGKELESIYGNQPNPRDGDPLVQFQFDLNYDFELFFKPYCQNSRNDYQPLMYKVTIVTDHLLNQLSPYGTKPYTMKRFHTWPVTNNIHQLHNPHVLVSSMNSMVLKCGEQMQPKAHKLEFLIPPILQWFVPPFISDFEYHKDDTRHKMDLFRDVNFQSYLNEANQNIFGPQNFNIILEFNKPDVIIDPSASEIVITGSWKGLRYYLFQYRLLSYLIGTAILWVTSSGALLFSVSVLIFIRELRSKAQDVVDEDIDETEPIAYKESPIRLRRGKSGEFYGRDDDNGIDFRIGVEETDVPIEESSQITSETTSTT